MKKLYWRLAFGFWFLAFSVHSESLQSIQFVTQNWRLKNGEKTDQLNQSSFPIYLRQSIGDNFQISVRQPSGQISQNENPIQIGGFGDTELQLSYTDKNGTFRTDLRTSFPTGKSGFDHQHSELLNRYYAEIFGFDFVRLGDGLDLQLAATGTKAIGRIIFSGGASYLRTGKYDLQPHLTQTPNGDWIESGRSLTYDSGDLLQLSIGSLFAWAGGRWFGQLNYRDYATDRINGLKSIEEGSAIEVRSAWRYHRRNFTTEIFYWHTFRSSDQSVATSAKIPNRNSRKISWQFWQRTSPTFRFGGGFRYLSQSKLHLELGAFFVRSVLLNCEYQISDPIKLGFGVEWSKGKFGTVDLNGRTTFFSITTEYF